MPKKGIQYVQNEDPAFIRRFKEKVGHKDGPDVNTKRQIPNFDDDGEDSDEMKEEKEDEKPMVVVVKKGDLTADEAVSVQKEVDDGPARLDEKITFKKRVKRNKEEEQTEEEKKTEEKSDGKSEVKKSKKSSKDKDKNKANKSLLSFGDEEEEES